ncbi:MAG TPA: Ig-like domain-containing protein [Isosphaeraceae bacterium]|nr:Ig-like domain-containing protein [Isosphaeraceae bacterium]
MASSRLRRRAARLAVESLEGRALLSIGFTIHPVAQNGGYLSHITTGPDGNLWFTDNTTSKIGRITPQGAVTEWALPQYTSPGGIAAGSDGALWFTEENKNAIGRITTAGAITSFPLPPGLHVPDGIVAGPDGALWFTEDQASNVGRITTAGVVTEFPLPVRGFPAESDITVGPDGSLWEVRSLESTIDRIAPNGAATEFALTDPNGHPDSITAGPDGALWFTVPDTSMIGRISTTGVMTEFPVDPSHQVAPRGITLGPDGNLWFASGGLVDGSIGRITPSGTITLFPAPYDGYTPSTLTTGPDGNLWYINGPEVGTVLLNATDAPLTVTGMTINAVERTPFSNTVATFTDADPNAQVGDFSARIDWGSGLISQGVVTSDGHGGFVVSGSNWFSEQGTSPVKVTVFDLKVVNGQGGVTGSATSTANVVDAPVWLSEMPISALANVPFNGQLARLYDAASFSPPPGNSYDVSIDWGDGTPVTAGSIGYLEVNPPPGPYLGNPVGAQVDAIVAPPSQAFVYGQHLYNAAGTYTLHIRVTDDGGSSYLLTEQQTVINPPNFNALHGIDVSATENEPLTSQPLATFAYSDTSDPSRFSATILWGDGTSSPGTVTLGGLVFQPVGLVLQAVGRTAQAASSGVTLFQVTGSHTYREEGKYLIQIVVQVTIGDAVSAPVTVQSTANVGDAPLEFSSTPIQAQTFFPFTTTVTSFADTEPGAFDPTRYVAAIDWGDGTLSGGTVVLDTTARPWTTFDVVGTHAYASAGEYAVTIHILDKDGGMHLSFNAAHVTSTTSSIIIAGGLNPASDSGRSSSDGVTNNNQPNFQGLAVPGSLVRLIAVPVGSNQAQLLGQAMADASGHWSVTSSRLADGTYNVYGAALNASGTIIGRAVIATGANGAPLRIVTAAPEVTNLKFDPTRGLIVFNLADGYGIDMSQDPNPRFFHLTRIGSRTELPLGVTISLPPMAANQRSSAPGPIVIVAINQGQPLPPGRYVFQVDAQAFHDVAGNALAAPFRTVLVSKGAHPVATMALHHAGKG